VRFAELRRAFASRFGRAPDLQGSIDPKLFGRRIRPLGDEVIAAERTVFEEAILVARQQLDAAELLSNAPHRAESIHVLVRALSALEEAIAHLRRGLPDAARVDELLPEALTQSLPVARQRLDSSPRLDASLSQDDIRFWRTTLARARRLSSWLLTLGQSRRAFFARRGMIAAIVLAPVLVLFTAFLIYSRSRDPFTVSASDYYASDQASSPYYPEKAVDGDETTEWLTPEGKDGWLELDFRHSANVVAIAIVNARNAPYDDRGTEMLEIELFQGTERVRRVEVKLEAHATTERRVAIDAERITRVRLTAHSHYGHSAGLAEVRVLEK
jgi:hypothetical protein